MTDEPNELKRLEEATAQPSSQPSSQPSAPLDDETASLREGWLALGQLLETAQPSDEPFEVRPLDVRPALSQPTQSGPVAVLATMAAALLIGLTIAWFLVRGGPQGDLIVEPPKDVPKEAPNAPTPDAPTPDVMTIPESPELAVDETPMEEPAEDPLAWDDSFDDQLAMLSDDLISIQQDWYYLDDPVGPIFDGLEQMEEEF